MSAAQHTPGPLQPDCMRILDENAVSAEAIGVSMVTLHNCDGDWLFRVHKDIAPVDLRTLLAIHRDRFAAGERAGRENAFAALRAFIGVDTALAKAQEAAS
ncbi:hypothetical protein ABL849_17425 [Variovorax sp. 375MFSha3.1]|uniref:hypothetical protein n=1 Tax=Variovorax sp. 375MFSha3.1 TaxID=3158364 RepID=UPI003AACD60E